MEKVKLISHTDLDGYGCEYILKAFGFEVDAVHTNYDKVNDIVIDYITSGKYKEYDRTFITDISINDKVAKLINDLYIIDDINIVLLDHHITAMELNKYDWCYISETLLNDKTCGTELVYQYILKNYITELKENTSISSNYLFNIIDLVNTIRIYDTWIWKETDYLKSKYLNDLFYILGNEKFWELLSCNGYLDVDMFIGDYFYLIEIEQEKTDNYIKKKQKEIIKYPIDEYMVGIVFANKYHSELGNVLAETNTDCDLIAIIGENNISYRTIKDIDCSEFAKRFGGGGHPKASGSPINLKQKDDIVKLLFANPNKKEDSIIKD